MSLETWIAFTGATMVILAIPGPTILLVISYALGYGRKTAVTTAAGVAMGDFVAMTASMLGLGALLATSADLFTVLRWIGGAYLVYLGIKLWRAPVQTGPISDNDNLPERKPHRIMGHAFIVTALNPKSIVFFVAFVPQFIDHASPFLPQMIVMEATFVTLAALNAIGYALLADKARRFIRKASVQRTVNRTGGTLLISAGAVTAAYSRAA
ncbi:LysE family translocator [Rhizobium sp. L1K21]|uniref:LysE family translocator n=1 Tax=Rhizobium sp. L1K21 TaxID=2954933 RepID=UPI0020927C49|nr:LysE family translocator [Rhizobium sp. L1K21]MCO6185627.1 LysE family translocator [Rhizobium sp. L1K21]